MREGSLGKKLGVLPKSVRSCRQLASRRGAGLGAIEFDVLVSFGKRQSRISLDPSSHAMRKRWRATFSVACW